MTDRLFREIELDYRAADDSSVPATISSTYPVQRAGYVEVLSHDPTAIDLSRSPLPLVEGHDTSKTPIGVVENLVADGKRLRGSIRFGKSQRARELLADIRAGVVRNLSVGYEILDEAWDAARKTLTATKWRIYEASVVAVPADPTAQFFRSYSMTDNASGERTRATEILAIGRMHKCIDEAEQAIADGASVEQFRAQVLERLSKGARSLPTGVDLSTREQQQYSVLEAIQLQLDPAKAERKGSLVLEVHRELDRQARAPARGIRVPFSLSGKRDLTTSTATGTAKSGYLVATETGDLIDILRNKMILTQLGVTRLAGLQGNIVLPRKTTSATSYWVAENSAPTEGNLAFDSVSLTPKTAAAFVDFSRRFMIQSTVDAEQLVRSDLMESMARLLDAAAIGGANTNGPTGIRGTSGVGSVAIGTNGGAPTWTMLTSLMKEVEIDNAAGSSMAFLSNDKVAYKLRNTLRSTADTASSFILGESGTIAGKPFITSNTVPSNLTKGGSGAVCSAVYYADWSQLIWATWGNSFDLLTDPYTGSSAGTVRVTCFTDCDFALRHPEAAAVCLDVTTS